MKWKRPSRRSNHKKRLTTSSTVWTTDLICSLKPLSWEPLRSTCSKLMPLNWNCRNQNSPLQLNHLSNKSGLSLSELYWETSNSIKKLTKPSLLPRKSCMPLSAEIENMPQSELMISTPSKDHSSMSLSNQLDLSSFLWTKRRASMAWEWWIYLKIISLRSICTWSETVQSTHSFWMQKTESFQSLQSLIPIILRSQSTLKTCLLKSPLSADQRLWFAWTQ